MALPDYFLQELKSRVDIGDVVSSYVNLKRRGKALLGLCPFHNEKTASFNVSTENGYFHCFGCGAGGDVITFIMKIENLDYIEAVKFLAQRAGLQMPEDGYDNSLSILRAKVLEINRETAKFYHGVLNSEDGKNGLDYFKNRGMDLKIIRHFGLGFAPYGKFELVNHLKKLGYKPDEMVAANVAFMSRNGNPVDRFYGRVMFPIIDLRGNVIAFGGRILTDEKPKYINSSDTLVYKKSTGLFAMNFAKNSKEQFILAEGYMDVISLHQAGFTGAIASLGTALTMEQSKIIARYTKEVVVCFDSDEAGQKAIQRAIPMLRNAGLMVKVLTIPNGKDPDGFIKSGGRDGPIKFKALLDGCGNDLEYRMWKIRATCNMEIEQGKIEYLTQCAKLLGTVDNSIERDVYASKLAQELSVDKSAIMTQITKAFKQNIKKYEQNKSKQQQKEITGMGDRVNPEKMKNLKIANAEEALIAYMFANPDGIDFCRNNIEADKFITSFGKRVYSCILGKNIGSHGISLTDLSGDFTQEEISSISRILMKYSDANTNQSDAKEYIGMILEEGQFSNVESIKKADADELADYLKDLRNRKK